MNKSIKKLYKMRYLPLLLVPLLVVMMVLPATLMASGAGGDPVPLGTTESFAVLAGSAITDVPNTSTIDGDIGLSPAAGSNITGLTSLQVSGTIYAVDSTGPAGDTGNNPGLVNQAKTDLTTAYNNAAGRTPTETFSEANNSLGGKTLTSGVYAFPSGTTDLVGTLILDAQGDPNAVFIFQASSTLITASSSVVSLINDARFCRVFWVVPTSATLGTGSTFIGHIFADQSITVTTGVTVYGQLLAQKAAVTLDTDTIVNGPCPEITSTTTAPATTTANSGTTAPATATTTTTTTANSGTLTIYKIDSNGNPIVAASQASVADFDIYANAEDIGVNPPLQTRSTIIGTNSFSTSLQNGTYYVVEKSAPEGYDVDSVVRSVTISGKDASLTFVNTTIEEVAAAETSAATTTTTPPATVTSTVTGGQLPKTGTPWYNVLLTGIILILIGAVVWITRKVYEKRSKI